ncbi:alpha/beta hydrolase [Staphylococcus gallinarum]|nr:alpha/beta hydrolase [Staphylococcus gallinarum]
MLFNKIALFLAAQVTLSITGFILLSIGLGIRRKFKHAILTILVTGLKLITLLVLTFITILLIICIISPKPVTLFLQNSTGAKNSYNAPPSKTMIIDKKYQLTTNIKYGDKYPRSYLNIITPTGHFDKNRPTYFYVHGGGFIQGDSMGGDPNASTSQNTTLKQYEKMIDHGFNVVTINYALAPQYVHPTPVNQLSEAVNFMKKNDEKYKINMDSVVFAGGSSGGFIAADFTTIQTNPQYSKESGIKPVIKSKNIKALVLESPALDASRGHKTKKENLITDYIFGQSMAAYFDMPVVSGNEDKINKINLIKKVTSESPPTYISDGNTGTFADQARDYYHILKEHNVKSELYIPDIKKSEQGHGFMFHNMGSKASHIYLEKKFEFLKSLN